MDIFRDLILHDKYNYYQTRDDVDLESWEVVATKHPLYINKMFPLVIEGQEYSQAHLEIHAMAVKEGDQEVLSVISERKVKKNFKELIKKLSEFDRSGLWLEVAPSYLYAVARLRISTDESLKNILLNTGNKFIGVVGSDTEKTLGIDKSNAEKQFKEYKGQNLWGIVLMRLRSELLGEEDNDPKDNKEDETIAIDMNQVSPSGKTYEEHLSNFKYANENSVWTNEDAKIEFLAAYRMYKLKDQLDVLNHWIYTSDNVFLSPMDFIKSLPSMADTLAEIDRVDKALNIEVKAPSESSVTCNRCGKPARVRNEHLRAPDEPTSAVVTCAFCKDPRNTSKNYSYVLNSGNFWASKRVGQ